MKIEFHNFLEDVLFNELLQDMCYHKTELSVNLGRSEALQKNFDEAEARFFRYLEDEFVKMP